MDLNNQTWGGNGTGFTSTETSRNGVSTSKGVSGNDGVSTTNRVSSSGACGSGIATQAEKSNSDTIFN